MKTRNMIMRMIILICITITTLTLAVSAKGNAGVVSDGEAKISYGLDVIADANKIEFAGIIGSSLNFSAEKFACAMNLSDVSEIVITSLPNEKSGVLYFGSSPVECGQRISRNSIGLMSYEKSSIDTDDVSTFKVRVNGCAYDIECCVYMLDKLNASPKTSGAPAISLNVETYKRVSAKGVLFGSDEEGDDLIYEIVSYPQNGYISSLNKKSGEYVYTPISDYTGRDEFKYVVKDKYGNYSASASVSISVSSPYSSIVYSDLAKDDCYNYALHMTEKNVMNGERVGDYYYFRPDSEVSRVDFIVSAMKMLGIENVPSCEKTVFADDTDIGDEVKGYISLAYSKQYISGIEDGEKLYFKPDEKIKLAEAAVILSNMIGYSKYDSAPAFANGEDIPEWSKQAVMSLKSLGVIEAVSDSRFENTTVNRGDMAKLLSRACWVSENL